MNTFTCGGTDEHPIKGSEFESCLVGSEGDYGDQARYRLCDFKASC